MKRLLAAVGTAALGIGLVACGTSGTSSSSQGTKGSAKQTITVWFRNDEPGAPGPVVKAFEAAYPNITVNESVIPGPVFSQKLGTAIAAGNAPDVVSLNDIDVPYFANQGTLANITQQVQSLSFKNDLSPGMVALGKFKNAYYGVPNDSGLSVLLYNKTLFKKAGLNPDQPPKTWAQMLQDAKAISSLGNGTYGFSFAGACPGCYAFTELPFIWASGGNVLNSTGTQATVSTSAPTKSLITLLHTMVADKLTPPSDATDSGATWGEDFLAGKVGMLPQAPQTATAAQQKGIDVGVEPIPGENGGESTFVGGDDWVITKASTHEQAAWDFIKFNLGIKAQDILASKAILPVRSDVLTPTFKKEYPFLSVALGVLPQGKAPYLVNYDALFNDANGPFLAMMEDGIFKGQVEQAVQQGQSGFTKIISQG